MKKANLWAVIAFCVLGLATSVRGADPSAESIADKATHKQVTTLQVSTDQATPLQVNAFCLNAAGQILAACGDGPGQVRVLDGEGQLIRSWDVSVKPESIHAAADGTILVGGVGRLFRFAADGSELVAVDSPHIKALKENAAQLREEAARMLSRQTNSLGARIATYKQIIAQLEERAKTDELRPQEELILKSLPQQLAQMEAQAAELEQEDQAEGPSEEAIDQQVDNMIRSKARVASISTNGDHVFIATHSPTGYTYDVWRLDEDMKTGEVIVTGLRGCCGQMDVQVSQDRVYAAENSRHRVVAYAADGTEQLAWGERDRTGVEGFSSCCNPMNVCFNPAGEVFTAEASTGRIKKFGTDGKLLAYIGDVELVPGCKNVSIAVSPDESRVYMLDITRNHIVVMQRQSEQPAATVGASSNELIK